MHCTQVKRFDYITAYSWVAIRKKETFTDSTADSPATHNTRTDSACRPISNLVTSMKAHTVLGAQRGRQRHQDKCLLSNHCHGCRDVSQLLQEQIELYRMTKQNILQGLSEEAFTQMTPQARERALLQEMKSDHNLHPALYPHDKGPFTGHYKVTVQSHMIVWGCQR